MSSVQEFNYYIAPDGFTYAFDEDPRYKWVVSEEGTGMPPITYLVQRGPFQHGETLLDYRLDPRTIQLIIRHDACSRDEYWDLRTNLLNALRPNRNLIGSYGPGRLRKVLSNGDVRDIWVVIQQGPMFAPRDIGRWDEWGFTEALRFIAHDPIYFDPTLQVSSAVKGSDDYLIFPFTFDGTNMRFSSYSWGNDFVINYTGTFETFPLLRVVGPCTSFIITNQSTGDKLELLHTLDSSSYVTFNLSYGYKTVFNDSGDNLLGSLSLDSDLATFSIVPDPKVAGGVNNIRFDALGVGATTRLTIEYYNRYIGV